ncbi:hypothetical protein ACVGWR_01655, partial [Enterobacter hormaechei]
FFFFFYNIFVFQGFLCFFYIFKYLGVGALIRLVLCFFLFYPVFLFGGGYGLFADVYLVGGGGVEGAVTGPVLVVYLNIRLLEVMGGEPRDRQPIGRPYLT